MRTKTQRKDLQEKFKQNNEWHLAGLRLLGYQSLNIIALYLNINFVHDHHLKLSLLACCRGVHEQSNQM
jgi:hypothetical protein